MKGRKFYKYNFLSTKKGTEGVWKRSQLRAQRMDQMSSILLSESLSHGLLHTGLSDMKSKAAVERT